MKNCEIIENGKACEGRHFGHGMCNKHYMRQRKYGSPCALHTSGVKRQQQDQCRIEGCAKPYLARGLCAKHYARWQTHGDPTKEPYAEARSKVCTADGCGRRPIARGWCHTHYKRWQKHGDPHFTEFEMNQEVPTYKRMHARMKKLKTGKCSTTGCLNAQTEMALIHGRGEFVSDQRSRYSNRTEDYMELCTGCHRAYDA